MPFFMRRLVRALLLSALAVSGPATAQADHLYGISWNASTVYVIDLNTGAATPVGSTSLFDAVGLAADDTGALYAITDHTFPPPGTTNLYVVDPWAGTTTLVGTAAYGGGEGALVYDPVAGHFWSKHNLTGGGGGTTQTLMAIDPGTGAGTLVGNMGLNFEADVSGMALLPNGDLIGYDAQSSLPDQLVSIDKGTGAASVIGVSGSAPLTSLGGLAVHPVTGTAYLSNAQNLYEVDPGTGALTLIGPHNGPIITGLTFGPGPGGACIIGLDETSTLYDVSHVDGTGSFPRNTGVNQLGGLAMAPNGTLYALRYAAPFGELYTLDPVSGAATLVGTTGNFPMREGGLDFDPVSGNLYGCHGTNAGELYTIDTGTGTVSFVGTVVDQLGFGVDLSALAFDAAGNLFGLKTLSAPEVYHINPSNAAVTLRVPIQGFPAGIEPGGMEFDDATGTLYAVLDNRLFILDPNTGATTILGPTPIRSALEVVSTCAPPPPTVCIVDTGLGSVAVTPISLARGRGHVPTIDACGESARRGEVSLREAAPRAPALFLGALPPADPIDSPWGRLVARPVWAQPVMTSALGEARVALPPDLAPAAMLAQWAVLDASAPGGIALSGAALLQWR